MKKILRIFVSTVLLTWLAWHTDWGQVAAVFRGLRLELWLGAVGLYIAAQVVSGWRWKMLARLLGFERPLWQFTGFYFIGMYFNLVLPTSVGGDVVRAWYLDGRSGRRRLAVLSVLSDRLSGLVVLLALAGLAVCASPQPLPGWITAGVWSAVGCTALGLAVLPRLAKLRPVRSKYATLGKELRRSLRFIFRPSSLLPSLIVQSINIILVWLLGRAIVPQVPGWYYWIMVPMVTLLTLLPVSINGMGVREGAMVLFLEPFGVAHGTALSLAFLWFSVFTAASLLGGAVYLIGRFPSPEVRDEHEPVHYHPDQGRAGQSQAAA